MKNIKILFIILTSINLGYAAGPVYNFNFYNPADGSQAPMPNGMAPVQNQVLPTQTNSAPFQPQPTAIQNIQTVNSVQTQTKVKNKKEKRWYLRYGIDETGSKGNNFGQFQGLAEQDFVITSKKVGFQAPLNNGESIFFNASYEFGILKNGIYGEMSGFSAGMHFQGSSDFLGFLGLYGSVDLRYLKYSGTSDKFVWNNSTYNYENSNESISGNRFDVPISIGLNMEFGRFSTLIGYKVVLTPSSSSQTFNKRELSGAEIGFRFKI